MKDRLFLVRYLEEDGIRIVLRRDLRVRYYGSLFAMRVGSKGKGKRVPSLAIDRADPFSKRFPVVCQGRSLEQLRRQFIRRFMDYARLTLLVKKEPGVYKLELQDRDELRNLVQGIEIYRPADRRGQKAKWWAKEAGKEGVA